MSPHERVISHVQNLVNKAKPTEFNQGNRWKETSLVNKANKLGRAAEQRTKEDLERTGKYLVDRTGKYLVGGPVSEMQYIHGKLAKEHEAAATAHEKAAAAIKVANISDLAFNATFQAHHGEGDHFETAKLHGLAAEALEKYSLGQNHSPVYHRELEHEHLLLAGHGNPNATGSATPGTVGEKVARQVHGEVFQQQIDHELGAAEHHHQMAEAHKAEQTSDHPVFSNSEWDEAKHPRDKDGKFT